MQKPISLRVSDNIEDLMATPEPVVALNLMGLSLLSSQNFFAEKSVFWVDGVLGSVACRLRGLPVQRKPGRELLGETIGYIREKASERPVVVLGADCELIEMGRLLGRDPICATLPWIRSADDVANLNFAELGPDYIVFLAIGSPKQEWVANAIFTKVGAKCFCVGGAINMMERRESIVPSWIQTIGFEWLYRLASEPKRRLARLFATLPSGVRNLRYARGIERLE